MVLIIIGIFNGTQRQFVKFTHFKVCTYSVLPCLSFCTAANILLGDGLVLISATLYAVSNVCQEYTVKNLSRVEFLGMVGLFGTLISGIQMYGVSHT